MPDSVMVFTFSPVQSFISESRRTADLHAASQILVHLARAAARSIATRGRLIYPAVIDGDLPNKIVARVPEEQAEVIAEEARARLLDEWSRISDEAKHQLMAKSPAPDDTWNAIWDRQVGRLWEVYWAAASMSNRSYKEAYDQAMHALDAAKRTRAFESSEERGQKDTLSGHREALHTAELDAKAYWLKVAEHVTAAKLQPAGRERLDAVGATKRFVLLDDRSFLSTSSVAASNYLDHARTCLPDYRSAVEALLGTRLYPVSNDVTWPYDGDLLFAETLTPHRLKDSYGLEEPDRKLLEVARNALREVYKRVGSSPSPYYGIIVLDADDMGARVNRCLEDEDPESAHRDLSAKLHVFSSAMRRAAGEYKRAIVYSGGDDLLAMAPLKTALRFAQHVAGDFEALAGGTASAGIAVVHHLYPLGAALAAARQAEHTAKLVPHKASVCIRVLKRAAEAVEMCSPWSTLAGTFDALERLFSGGPDDQPLAFGFANEAACAAHTLACSGEQLTAELKRLIKRHRNPDHPHAPDPDEWARRLWSWAQSLPRKSRDLANWLLFARFLAQGGVE